MTLSCKEPIPKKYQHTRENRIPRGAWHVTRGCTENFLENYNILSELPLSRISLKFRACTYVFRPPQYRHRQKNVVSTAHLKKASLNFGRQHYLVNQGNKFPIPQNLRHSAKESRQITLLFKFIRWVPLIKYKNLIHVLL